MFNTPEPTITIVISVISGILTSAILFILLVLFKKIIVPWYQDLIYKGIDIGGRWFCSDFSMAQELTFDLIQKASVISGTATLVNKGATVHEFEDIRTFAVRGFIQDRFVHLVLSQKDTTRLGILSYLLETVGDGRRMIGAMSFYSVRKCAMDCGNHVLWREKAQADAERDRQKLRFEQLVSAQKPTTSKKKPKLEANT